MRSHIWRLLAAVFLSLGLASCSVAGPAGYPLVAAHRGDKDAGPDNSRSAIAAGVAKGIPYLEIDVRYTKDKAMVLSHDKTVRARVYSGTKIPDDTPIKEVTLAELRSAPLTGDGHPILTFEEAVAIVAGTRTRYLLDIKERDPELLMRIVAAAESVNGEANLVVQCQSLEIARYVRSHYPTLRILARADNSTEVSPYLELHPEIVQIDSEWADAEIVQRIKASGSLVLIKAVDLPYDNESGWRMLRKQGADIVLTDHPEELLAASGTGVNPNRSRSISAAF